MTEPTIVDPSGDLIVQVGENEHQNTFIVSPKAMSLASHVVARDVESYRALRTQPN